jgi:hypothetical protein
LLIKKQIGIKLTQPNMDGLSMNVDFFKMAAIAMEMAKMLKK